MGGAEAGSKATIVLFDLKELRVKLGCLDWSPLRVLKGEVGLGNITIDVDDAFLKKGAALPGFEEYASASESAASQPEPNDVEQDEQGEDLAAMGFLVPISEPVDHFAAHEDGGDALEHDLGELIEELYPAKDDSDSEEDVSIEVYWDDHGNLCCTDPEIETVLAANPKEAGEASEGYHASPSWIHVSSKNLTALPDAKGCGLCYNRTGFHTLITHCLMFSLAIPRGFQNEGLRLFK